MAPNGAAVGVDISGPALALAHKRAAAASVPGVSFAEADAQVHPFEPGAFDALINRFGTMFFADPVAAFASLPINLVLRLRRQPVRAAVVPIDDIDRIARRAASAVASRQP